MKKLKVLMQNRPKAQWIGGDMIKLEKTMEGLQKLGVDVTFNDQPIFTPALLLSDFDIVHTWNFSMPWTKYQVWAGKRHGCKLVCSMIYHETEQFIPYEHQQIMLDSLDAAIYETPGEVERVKRHLQHDPKKTYIIPNGIDKWWFDKTKDSIPYKDYVLTVGRVEPSKGQLEVAKACKLLNAPYIMIGEVVDVNYLNMCIAEGATIYPPTHQKELKLWYKNCAVYVQASFAETWSMAVDEAGSQGVPIVVSTGFERKDIPDAVYCEHQNVASITEAIKKAILQGPTDKFKKQLKKRTWDYVAKEYLKIYEKIV